MTDTNPVLYILMRNDLSSMNAGKAMAQASHASNAFWKQVNNGFVDNTHPAETQRLLNEWQLSTSQGFGTVLVLGVDESQMRATIEIADKMGFVSDIVNDPTYPIQIPSELGVHMAGKLGSSGVYVGEGYGYVTIPLDTCAYVFGDKNNPILSAIVGHFPLHP